MIEREEKHVWIVEPDDHAEEEDWKRGRLYDKVRDSSGHRVGWFKKEFENESSKEGSKGKWKRRSRSWDWSKSRD